MNPNTDFAAMLEKALGILQSREASAATLRAGADQARGVVATIDEESELAPQREATVLAALVSKSIGETLAALAALDDQMSRRMLERKVATALAAQLDGRAREVAKAETERDERRRPFLDQTRRAQDLAKRIADYPTLAERIVILLRTDIVIARLGESAYSRTPRPQGSHVGYRLTFTCPRTIATPDVLKATKLPGFWPPKWSDYSLIERSDYEFEGDAGVAAPVRSMILVSSEVLEGGVVWLRYRLQNG